jgi:hypothetical protein
MNFLNNNYVGFKNGVDDISTRFELIGKSVSEWEKFLFSKTLFVGLTDGWHLFKLIRNFSLFFGIFLIFNLTYSIWLSFLFSAILRIIYGVIFTLFYNLILKKI